MELIEILYSGAIDAVREARRHLQAGAIAERSNAISRAVEIVEELNRSLNFETGGELSIRLAGLYDYIQRALLDANFRQNEDGLQEAESLLGTLREGWVALQNRDSGMPINDFVAAGVATGFGESPQWTA